jgi:hypothetical protein
MRVCSRETHSLTRGWVCSLHLLLDPARPVFLRSESCETHDQIWPNLRLSQYVGPGSSIYFPKEQCSPVLPPGIFPFISSRHRSPENTVYHYYKRDLIFVKATCKCFQRKEKGKKTTKKTAQIGTSVRACVFNAGLLARSQFASGRSCDRPTRSRFSVVFLGPRANAELVPKFHVALHASHPALPMVT